MENLLIKHNTAAVIRKILAVIMIINGIFWILGNVGNLKFYHWIFAVVFIFMGITYLTHGFGTELTYIYPGEGNFKLKWMNRFRPVIVNDADIEGITLCKYKILLTRKGQKPLNLNLDFYEIRERELIYNYFINLAKERNIDLVKEWNN